MNPLYTIERWPYGWTISALPRKGGVPMNALSESLPLFEKGAVMDSGIVHHLRQTGSSDVCVCIVSEKNSILWRDEIAKELSHRGREDEWWLGTDVGISSATIFSVFYNGEHPYRGEARAMGQGNIPKDTSDFGRCKRLLDLFPEWKTNLRDVGAAYPDTKWNVLAENWESMEAMTGPELNEYLKNL